MKDTLAIVDDLKNAGFEDRQARGICNVVNNTFASKNDLEKMQTGIDHALEKMQTGIDHALEKMQTEMDHRFDKVDVKFDKLDSKLNLLMWAMGLGFAAAYGLKLFA